MEERVLNIDGMSIAFTRRGQGAPLILIHGYPLDRTIWSKVAELLEDEFDLIIPDLRGFGASDVMEADRSIIGYASDLAGLMERLKVRKAHIVGHSMGGYVALAFAREFARKTAGLGLIASQVVADSAERKAARQATARQIIEDGIGDVVDGMAPKLSPDAEVQALVRGVIAQQRPLGLAVALDAMAGRPDSTDVLRSFKLPMVIVHGDADELIPVERGREMKSLQPYAKYLELPGAGHLPMLENPVAVAEALRFLGAVKQKSVKILDD
ncbi:MAG: alpha/beta hydrolase [Chloroflexota bacterium]